jgi:hypothetical protein
MTMAPRIVGALADGGRGAADRAREAATLLTLSLDPDALLDAGALDEFHASLRSVACTGFITLLWGPWGALGALRRARVLGRARRFSVVRGCRGHRNARPGAGV